MRRLDAAQPLSPPPPSCDAAGMAEVLIVAAVFAAMFVAQWWSLR